MKPLTVAEIARRLGAAFEGDGGQAIRGVAGIRYAQPGDLTFISQSRYAADANDTEASAIMVGKDWTLATGKTLIKVDRPEQTFSEVATWFAPPPIDYLPGIHPTAVVSPDAIIGKDVHIGPYCIIGRDVTLGNRTILVGHNFIADGVTIGDDGLIHALVSIREHVKIGHRVIIHNGAVIGSDGFGYHVDAKGIRTKIPQIGIVEISDDVEIGANTTIDRARFGKTTIGQGVKIDNLVMIGHNVVVGDHSVIISQAGIAGSSTIGKHVILAGQAGVAGHITIGDGAIIGAQGGVTKDIPAKIYAIGFPATPYREYGIQQAHIHRLPEMKKRLAELESRLTQLEARGHS